MKLKSLILGSVAAAGLSTAGYAADLGVLTSLDVCDSLGLSGLTISSDTNCLQISGGVSYEFSYGDFRSEDAVARTFDGSRNLAVDNGPADWTSKVEAWLRFVGTAPSDFGPAKAVIKLKEVDITRVNRTQFPVAGNFVDADGEQDFTFIDEAYVAVGDTTVIMAGKKGSIANLSDDEPYNILGLFNSDAIDGKGVGVDGDYSGLGGHVIQVTTDLGNGINASVGLENLNGSSLLVNTLDNNNGIIEADEPATHGTLVGVLSYSGETITAHVTGMAFGILDGNVETWAVHAGATGTFDAFKIRGAVAYWDNFKYTANDIVNALVSAQGNFDMFTIAASAEVANSNGAQNYTDYGFGGSIGVNVSEGIALNLAARYFRDGFANVDTTQVAVQAVAAVTETLKLTAEVGAYFGNGVTLADAGVPDAIEITDNVYYGSAKVSWAPGGGFTSELEGSANNQGAYKVTFKAAKSFE